MSRRRGFYPGKGATKRSRDWYPYKNEYEYNLGQLLITWTYEDKSAIVDYIIPKTYNPDFTNSRYPWLLLEAKGVFLGGKEEARKYVEMRKCNPDKQVLFIFEDPYKKPYSGCKKRKDGSVMTLAEWAANNSFPFCHAAKIPAWLLDNTLSQSQMRDRVDDLVRRQAELYGGRIRA